MDKYDAAIEFLSKHPDLIMASWYDIPLNDRKDIINAHSIAHCLFQRCGSADCGCLTTIRGLYDEDGNYSFAATEALTEAIQNDERIPHDERCIEVSHLPIFAEWQRRLDKELGRTL